MTAHVREQTGPDWEEGAVAEFLALIGERGWPNASLLELADRLGGSLADLRRRFPDRISILEAYARSIDLAVLSQVNTSQGNDLPVRERLFDILMAGFDIVQRDRATAAEIFRAARMDPVLAARLNQFAVTSLQWMLRAAGVSGDGPLATVRAQALALVMVRVIDTWLKDDDPGMARTMSRLDKELRRAERMASGADRVLGILETAAGFLSGASPTSANSPRRGDASDGGGLEATRDHSSAAHQPPTPEDGDLPSISDFEAMR